MQLYKSKHKSQTTGEAYIVRIVMDKVEWIDNPNATKDTTAPLWMTILQRQRRISESVYVDDTNYRPFGIWKDNFNDFFEEYDNEKQ